MLAFTCFLAFFVVSTFSLTYDYVTSNRAVNFAMAAYCTGDDGHGVEDWSCDACKRLPTVQNVSLFDTGSFDNYVNGYVAYDLNGGNGDPVIVIAFAGGEPFSAENYLEDFDIVRVTYPPCDYSNCWVHKGWYDDYDHARDYVWDYIEKYHQMYGMNISIQITGHGFGGALATFCSLDLLLNSNWKIEWIYTYGQPRVGNLAFSSFYNNTLNVNGSNLKFRVTHNRDPVPNFPHSFYGYHHTPLEIFYPQDPNGTYVTCDGSGEDPTCSDKYIVSLDFSDHRNYMGYNFVSNWESCKL